MRVARSLLILLAAAFAVAGCAAPQPYMQTPYAQPAAYGIDNVTYGSPQRAYAQPAYAAPAYATSGRGFFQPGQAFYPQPAQTVVAPVQVAAAPAPVAVAPVAVAPVAVAVLVSATPIYPGPQGPYTLDSGDRLRVVVFGQDGLTNSYVVDASGHIAMPLIGSVLARGLTTDQLAGALTAKLRDGYIREPHVAVEVEAYRPFFILGEVTQPGQYPYVANMTAETAVAIAGGFGPRAFRRSVVLIRTYMGQQIRTEVPLSYALRPGDTINVQERWF
jgi:protein involved in polysaccharide export with SLBB domain